MKTTESYELLLKRFTKRISQVDPEDKERLSYLKGCVDTVEYLMTGKLPRDGNHDGMKDHKPVEGHVCLLYTSPSPRD